MNGNAESLVSLSAAIAGCWQPLVLADYLLAELLGSPRRLLLAAIAHCLPQMHFSCHRSLISDALLVRGWQVQHITAAGKPSMQHKLTKFARVEGA